MNPIPVTGYVVANGCEVHDKAAQFDASGARIGDTPNMICRVEYPYGCPEGRHAVARVFAAAPQMLEALRHLMRYDFGDSEGARLARAAIAAATTD